MVQNHRAISTAHVCRRIRMVVLENSWRLKDLCDKMKKDQQLGFSTHSLDERGSTHIRYVCIALLHVRLTGCQMTVGETDAAER